KNLETEIVVIGGGITGSLIAHQCINDGYQTVLIDRDEIAHGSTAASTSILQYEIDIPLFRLIDLIGEKGAVESYRACFDSIDKLKSVAEEINSESGFRKKDSLYFASRKKDLKWLKKEFETRKFYGFPVRWLQAEDIYNQYKLENTFGGILSEQGGSVDAFKLTHDILQFNKNKGLLIYDNTNVKVSTYYNNYVELITEHGNTIKANKIIYCTGYESTELIKDDFVNLNSTYAIVGEQKESCDDVLENTLFWNTDEPYIYMRTTDDNRLLIGGGDEGFENATRRDSLLHKKAEELKEYLKKIFPSYDFRTDFIWAGTFGETKDGLPYIGAHPDFAHSYFVLGFGGNGISFSVIGMEMISALLKNKSHPLKEYYRFRR
ncbi:MAG: FAD-binding oxidoreductase, partial [Bacteroidota bacterium]